MRSPPIALGFAGLALAAAFALVACSKHASAENDDAGDASGDDASDAAVDTSLSLGDDSSIGPADDASGDDSSTGNCVVLDGTYLVTMTPVGDAGGSGCVPTTSTMTFPLSTACMIVADGTLPVCTVNFWCTEQGTGTTTTNNGYVQVFNSSYSGYETVQIVSTMVGMPTLSTCSYDTEYTKQ